MKLGYDRNLTEEIQQVLIEAGASKNVSRPVSTQTDLEYFENFLLAHASQEIIVNNLESIGSFAMVQLSKVLSIVQENEITLTFLNTSIGGVNIQQDFLEVLSGFVTYDKKAFLNRTQKGLDHARSMGIIGGRPRISKDIQDKIYSLYFHQKKTYREIAEILHVSVGTVYKYSNSNKK